MKVLLFDTTPAYLSNGGKTTHAVKLCAALRKKSIDAQFAEWWNADQADVDIIHSLTPFMGHDIDIAKSKGIKTVLTLIMDVQTNLPIMQQNKQILRERAVNMLPYKFASKFSVNPILGKFDKITFMHEYDRRTGLKYYPNIDTHKTVIIPHAYDAKEFGVGGDNIQKFNLPEKYIISCANISRRKQSVECAKLCKEAKTPVVFIGGNSCDAYFEEFKKLVDNKYVYYLGFVSSEDKDLLHRYASGFILLSLGESGCMSVFDAAAYGLPLLLSNLPWAWGYQDPKSIYFCDFNNKNKAIKQIISFFRTTKRNDFASFNVKTWDQIADEYIQVYKDCLK